MAERWDWQHSEDRRDLIHRAVEALARGGLVILPTDTVYILAGTARSAESLGRLVSIHGEANYALYLQRPADCQEYVQPLPAATQRLVQRCWPGPVSLVFPESNQRERAFPAGFVSPKRVGYRVADHAIAGEISRLLKAPIVAREEQLGDPVTADEADLTWGAHATLLLDDGPTRYRQPSTIVKASASEWGVLAEGVVSPQRLSRLASEVITFVCTGNTCRSPMAEAIFKVRLANQLGCLPQELIDRGYLVVSAGVAAGGGPASSHAREVVRGHGASLDDHLSQNLTPELVAVSDRILVMTNDHRQFILSYWPQAESKTSLLLGNRDVNDPVGGSRQAYEACASQIAMGLTNLLGQLMSPQTKGT